ncbi:MarC family protein [Candidatus Micrarchaeota archaeon]|nr:MarC family protein [Candidatus Micrarchaeota archaeon]
MSWELDIAKAFIMFFIIMDPFASMPVFVSVTRNFKELERQRSADEAIMVAGGLVLVFLFSGSFILNLLRISLQSFQIAGGVIIFVMGMELVFGLTFFRQTTQNLRAAAVLIGTPLITGPGVITNTIILVNQLGIGVTLIAAMFALFANWLILRESGRIQKALGQNVIEVLSRIMGIMLVAIAIEYVREGFGIA